MNHFAVLTDNQQQAVNTIVQWASEYLAYMLPILPYLVGLVFIFALLYKFTLGSIKRL
jgi:hypothetical protein